MAHAPTLTRRCMCCHWHHCQVWKNGNSLNRWYTQTKRHGLMQRAQGRCMQCACSSGVLLLGAQLLEIETNCALAVSETQVQWLLAAPYNKGLIFCNCLVGNPPTHVLTHSTHGLEHGKVIGHMLPRTIQLALHHHRPPWAARTKELMCHNLERRHTPAD